MGRHEVLLRSQGYNPGGIDCAVADIIVRLDVLETHGISHARDLIQLSHIGADGRVICQQLAIGFEVAKVHCVKANECGKQALIRFGLSFAHQVALLR